jgi:hypothetical protein
VKVLRLRALVEAEKRIGNFRVNRKVVWGICTFSSVDGRVALGRWTSAG